MALSNILNEPRREITESAVGFLISTVPLYLDYLFAVWASHTQGGPPIILGMVLGLIGMFILAAAIFGFLLVTHGIGEISCDFLADHGIKLRPRQRY